MADAKDPPHVPRTTDRGHPNPRPPERAGKGGMPGDPGHSGPGGPQKKGDSSRPSSGQC
jgi:hypothetical protein